MKQNEIQYIVSYLHNFYIIIHKYFFLASSLISKVSRLCNRLNHMLKTCAYFLTSSQHHGAKVKFSNDQISHALYLVSQFMLDGMQFAFSKQSTGDLLYPCQNGKRTENK